MTFKYFSSYIATQEELRRAYIKLLHKYHPDNVHENERDSATEITKAIISEYKVLLKIIETKFQKRATHESGKTYQSKQNWSEEDFLYIINLLSGKPFISDLEVCGSFIWYCCEYQYKDAMLKLDFKHYKVRWAAKKKRFYICMDKDYRKRSRKEMSLEEIRMNYGSQRPPEKSNLYLSNVL